MDQISEATGRIRAGKRLHDGTGVVISLDPVERRGAAFVFDH